MRYTTNTRSHIEDAQGEEASKRSAAPHSAKEHKGTTPARTSREEDPMPKVPQLRAGGNPTPRPRSSRAWADLIAFLAVLALGGILIALGHVTAGSLATACVALGGLYAVWQRLRPADDPPPADEASSQPDEHPRRPEA